MPRFPSAGDDLLQRGISAGAGDWAPNSTRLETAVDRERISRSTARRCCAIAAALDASAPAAGVVDALLDALDHLGPDVGLAVHGRADVRRRGGRSRRRRRPRCARCSRDTRHSYCFIATSCCLRQEQTIGERGGQVPSGPADFGRHGGQDRLDVAAGLEAEHGAAVVEQVELDVAAAADQLLVAVGLGPGRRRNCGGRAAG